MDVEALENWMTNLPQKLKKIPIIFLAIPGSHDSITYGMTRKSKVAPDAEPVIQKLQFLGQILTSIMVNWAKTQTIDITQQLKQGIRYYDLRIATKKGVDDLYIVHGLYSVEVSLVLTEIHSFLVTHPNEVVIIDCQHFYAFQESDHERLMRLITSTFSQKLVPYSPNMNHLTLQYMTKESHYQVIAIYRSDAARCGQPLLWPSSCFPTPWADTTSVSKLINFLNNRLENRNNSIGFISQCILTPSSGFVFRHLFRGLKSKCFLPLEKDKYRWLRKQKPGRGGINIIISDFVDYHDDNFVKEVISLNQKLLLDPANKEQASSVMTPIDNSI